MALLLFEYLMLIVIGIEMIAWNFQKISPWEKEQRMRNKIMRKQEGDIILVALGF